ncbi:hypothetical protein MMC25_005439 [Agyrium rufum]|nr:hypothetical protein [Agyrium rufum]
MAISILASILLLPSALAVYNAYCLCLNYRLAQKIGVPIIVLPASPDNPLWALSSGKILFVVEVLFGKTSATTYGRLGWEFYDKSKLHLRYGDAVILVTPAYNWVYVCNAEAFNEIFQRRNGFPRPPRMMAMLDVFGPNISTRKITSTPFNEQNSSKVWREALRQAGEVLSFWKSLNPPIKRTARDTRTLSLHVLSGVGFGKSYSFHKSAEPPSAGHTFNYRDSLALILENAIPILVFGPKLLNRKFLPNKWRRIGQATVDFKFHMTEMMQEERRLISQHKPGAGNIISSLIKTSADQIDASNQSLNDLLERKGLTEEEIYGNIFIYNFAGHDTVAITFNTAIYLLAAYPNVQDWIAEEINAVVPNGNTSSREYGEIYPKLNRCLAVLLETVRLYNPLIGIAKSTGSEPQPLTVNGKQIIIPANSRVIPNINAMHSHPRYWGDDALDWRPSRWIVKATSPRPDPAPTGTTETISDESIFVPARGTYVPWSDGTRVCPGKKFAQVEFVACIVALFGRHRVEVVPKGYETLKEARKRVLMTVNDCEIVLLLQMKDPGSVGLRWVGRN